MRVSNRVLGLKFCSEVIALTFIAVSAMAQTTGPSLIIVDGARPLAQATLQLERQLGVPINYEDAPLRYSEDVVDVAPKIMSAEQQAAHPGAHIPVPKGGTLSVALPVAATRATPSSAVPLLLNALVGGYTAAGLSGTYNAGEENGSFFITPANARDASGASRPTKRIFDTKITLPFQERNAGDTLEAILHLASAGDLPVKVGTVPVGAMIRSRVQIGADDESARTVLVRLLSALGTVKSSDGVVLPAFSYHLNFDPGQNYYVLNIHVLPQLLTSRSTSPSGAGAASGLHSTPAVPSGPNPYVKH